MIFKLKNSEIEDNKKIIEQIAGLETEIFGQTAYGYQELLLMSTLDKTYNFYYYQDSKFNNEVVAYIIVLDAVDLYEVLKIAVLDKYRKQNIASKLLQKISGENKEKDIILEVRKSNIKAINCYLKNGFKEISIRKNYYSDNNEDAIVMKLEVNNEQWNIFKSLVWKI